MFNGTKSFRGLNNVTDSLRLGVGWLKTADNIDITDTGAIKKRAGYAKKLNGAISGSFSTFDYSRMYIVDGGVLKAVATPSAPTTTPLVSGLSSAPMSWTEINNQVYYNNGTDTGIIQPDNSVLPWRWPNPPQPSLLAVTGNLPVGMYRVCCTFSLPDGRTTGTNEVSEITLTAGQALQISGLSQSSGLKVNVFISPADSTVMQYAGQASGDAFVWNSDPSNLGVELQTLFMAPLPEVSTVIQAWRGRIYAAQYLASSDQTVIWFSQPLGFHLFDMGNDFVLVPGKVEMLAPHSSGLIIGTSSRIYAYTPEKLEELAPYGVVPGYHWAKDEEQVLFWSKRGLCSFSPFSNLTQLQVSVPPGIAAGGAIVRSGGQKRYLVALRQGGVAFNSHV